jgi:hypothetical protein
VLLLSLSAPLVQSLSSHSPQDLYAYPKFNVVLAEQGLLNDTVLDLLQDHRDVRSSSSPLPFL